MTGVDRYSRRHRIATGGVGEVWLAHDEVLHRDVAVKYLKHEYADDEGSRTRFLHEARNAAALLHPGIATVFDFGDSEVEDGLPFLVMEYVEGQPLSALLDGRPLDPERARVLIEQAATALAEAHAVGLVHRDVKPGNLMVTPDDAVKITDFGIARATDGLSLTETGQIVGTPSYISPEQAEGRSATPASDVYALGIVLFECLTGRRPFVADNPVATALAQVREPVPELPPEVPEGLAAVTRRALAKDPADRYADAAELADALRALGPEPTMVLPAVAPDGSAGAAASPATGPGTGPGTAPSPGATTAVLAGADGPVGAAPLSLLARVGGTIGARLPAGRRERVLLLGAAAFAVLVVGASLVALLTSGDVPKDTPTPGTTASAPPAPAKVKVDPAAYVGKRVGDVRAALTALGLTSTVHRVTNPGGHTADTVAALRPTGRVAKGTTITLDVWGTAPTVEDHEPAKDKPGKGKGHGKGKGRH